MRKIAYFLRRLHWSTLGQTRHSSCVSMLPGGAFSNPLKCAHFAGDSKTIGYSNGRTWTILDFSVTMSRRDMQYGQA